MKNKYWSNSCSRIKTSCREGNCLCYSDYLLWTNDNPNLDFNQWKELILLEREDLNEY